MRPQPGQAVTCGVKLRMPMRLQNLLRDANFFGAIAAGRGRERNANRIADAFLQNHAHGGGGCHHAFRAHAGFGQSEMQRIVAARGQRAIDVDQILHAADFRAENNLVGAQAVFFRQRGGVQRAHHHRFHGHFAGVFRLGQHASSRPSCG